MALYQFQQTDLEDRNRNDTLTNYLFYYVPIGPKSIKKMNAAYLYLYQFGPKIYNAHRIIKML